MEGSQGYNNYDTSGTQPTYDQNQYGFATTDQQTSGDQNYAGFNYMDAYQQPAATDFTTPADANAASTWYPQAENVSYTNYLPETPATNSAVNSNLFKTKLCRHFQQKGFCNMGDKCNFAHGPEELKQSSMGGAAMPKYPKPEFESYGKPSYGAPASQYKPHYTNPSESIYYKTALCKNFQEKGHCQFGDKCKFAHGESDLKPGPAKTGAGYNTYGYDQNYNPGFYQPPTAAAPGGFGYNTGYPYSYPAAEPSSVDAYNAPSAPQVQDPTQNYGYNYTPDSKYYQGFEYVDGTNTGSGTESTPGMSSGSETMNQYYNEMNYNQFNNGQQ